MKDTIKIGDTVCVNFHAAKYTLCSEAEVLHMPCAPGDSWGFRDLHSDEIHYVSEGCTVTSTTAYLPPLILPAIF